MVNERMEKMRRHLGHPKELKLGDDVFRLYPLPMEYLPDLYGGVLSKMDTSDQSKVVKSLDKDMIEVVKKLIRVTCERSPDIESSDKDVLDSFISSNFMELFVGVMEVNMPSVANKDSRAIKLMKDKYEKRKGLPPESEVT